MYMEPAPRSERRRGPRAELGCAEVAYAPARGARQTATFKVQGCHTAANRRAQTDHSLRPGWNPVVLLPGDSRLPDAKEASLTPWPRA